MTTSSIGRQALWQLLCVHAVLAVPLVAVAQPEPSTTGHWLADAPKAGTRVELVDRDGTSMRGQLLRVLPNAVLVASDGATREVPLSQTSLIRRNGDPVWEGAAWGGGLFGLMFLSYNGDCDDCYSGAQLGLIRLFYTGVGAGVGALIDAAIRDRRVLYRGGDRAAGPTVTLAPVISPRAGALRMALQW